MADKDRREKITPPRVPRPNYQLWIILGLVAVILGVSLFNKTGELVEIQQSRFEDMVQSRDVKKVVLNKQEELVIITLKAEALQNAKYKQEIERSSPLKMNTSGPHYKLKIGSIDKFIDKFEQINRNIPREQQIDLQIDKGDDYNWVYSWGFLFLLLFGFWMLMRRMTGGGGPGGQIFNIGKSKAALFDAEI